MRAPSGHRQTCPHRGTWAAGAPDADVLSAITSGLGITTTNEAFYSGPGGRTKRNRNVYQVSTAQFPSAAAILQSTQPAATAAPPAAATPATTSAAPVSAQPPAMTAAQQRAYGLAYYAIQQRLQVGWHLSQMTQAPEGHTSVAWTAAWAAHAAQRR